MKQPLFKGKANAIQVILISMDKAPERFDIITENIRIGEALNTAFRTLGSCSAWVGIGLMQENPESTKTEIRSLMMMMMMMITIIIKTRLP